MIKKIVTAVFLLGITTATFANSEQPSHTKESIRLKSCTLTVDCGNGETVTATAKDCATAGAMVDAGCG